MDVILAIQALKELLLGASALSEGIVNAQREGRPLTDVELAPFREAAQLSLDVLDAKIKAAGG